MNFIERFFFVLKRKIRKFSYRIFKYDFFTRNYKEFSNLKYFLTYSENNFYGQDIRGEWEQNRFQWIIPKVFEYLKNKNEDIAKDIFKKIESWIDDNPVGYGKNWICAMEPAIRISNWLLAINYLKSTTPLNHNFINKFYKSVEEHYYFIKENLEVTLKTPLANHYLSNIAGLLYISLLYPELKNSEKLKNNTVKELEKIIEQQVLADGVSFENSIGYHRFVLEIFLYCGILCSRYDIALSKSYWLRLEKMLEFVMHYTKPDGTSPNFGDSDDGFWHLLKDEYREKPNNHTYLLALGYKIFSRDDFRLFCDSIPEEINILTDNIIRQSGNQTSDKIESKAFAQGGFYFIKHDEIYLSIITRNILKVKYQPHKHNDVFSFELSYGDANFVVDSGTYCYTYKPEIRNNFRSTATHNTIKIDDFEQQDIDECGFFALPKEGDFKLINWMNNNSQDIIEGTFSRKYNKNYITHYRTFILFKEQKSLEIIDTIEGSYNHQLEWMFHLHPETRIKQFDKVVNLELKNKKLFFYLPDELFFQIINHDVSFRFGEKLSSKSLKLSTSVNLPFKVKFIIEFK